MRYPRDDACAQSRAARGRNDLDLIDAPRPWATMPTTGNNTRFKQQKSGLEEPS
jgi:hypothetical protein